MKRQNLQRISSVNIFFFALRMETSDFHSQCRAAFDLTDAQFVLNARSGIALRDTSSITKRHVCLSLRSSPRAKEQTTELKTITIQNISALYQKDVSQIFPWIKVLGSLKTFAVPKQSCCELCNLSQLFAQLTNRSPLRWETAAHSRGANEGCRLQFANPLCISDERAGSSAACHQWQMFSPVTFRTLHTLQTWPPLFL